MKKNTRLTEAKPGASESANCTTVRIDTSRSEPRIDTRLIAEQLGVKHQNTVELLRNHREDFEQFGILRFQTGEIDGRGQPQKFAMLNEDQCYLLLTYTRNTARVRALKVKLVHAFRDARHARELIQQEYLPTYHALHDEIHAIAAGSEHERFVHINFNKLLNKTVGVSAGARSSLPVPRRSLLIVAQMLAAKAMQDAGDAREAYSRAKDALRPLSVDYLAHVVGRDT